LISRGPLEADAYALIRRAALADGTLTFKARGILAYLLTRPAGSPVSAEKLAKSGTDGERAVKSGLKELEDAGYLLRISAEEGQEPFSQHITDSPGDCVREPVPRAQDAQHPARDGAERLAWLISQHPWLSPAALKTAHREIELQDLPLSLTKYEIRMKEMNKIPSSSEWLRWLIEDEQKMKLAERDHAREAGEKKAWYTVA
jgi:hypothetical protein